MQTLYQAAIAEFDKLAKERLAELTEVVCGFGVEDFPRYKFLIGCMSGLREARELMDRAIKKVADEA